MPQPPVAPHEQAGGIAGEVALQVAKGKSAPARLLEEWLVRREAVKCTSITGRMAQRNSEKMVALKNL